MHLILVISVPFSILHFSTHSPFLFSLPGVFKQHTSLLLLIRFTVCYISDGSSLHSRVLHFSIFVKKFPSFLFMFFIFLVPGKKMCAHSLGPMTNPLMSSFEMFMVVNFPMRCCIHLPNVSLSSWASPKTC